jgi:lipid II:glycine glycyltransferase (peptidoglycan interpeptide bridge formation enzyme)
MSNYKIKQISSKDKWEDFVLANNPKSFLQSWNWGETNVMTGNKIHRLGFYENTRLKGVCLAIEQDAKRGRHLIVPGGPIIDWGDLELVETFTESIKRVALERNAWFVRVRPELLDSQENKKLLVDNGFVSAPMHLYAENTWVLDIDKSEDEILYGMRKNTRYSVRKSAKHDLEGEVTDDVRSADILYDLQKQTVERHKFVGFPKELFEAQLATFGKDDQAEMFLCKRDDKYIVAAIIIYYAGTAYYHHSASAEAARDLYASYFLQWNIIKRAKERGLKHYNFWGIAPKDAKKHRFSGVTIFKKGFGGKRLDWLHAHDLPVSFKYISTFVFENMRKIVRGL